MDLGLGLAVLQAMVASEGALSFQLTLLAMSAPAKPRMGLLIAYVLGAELIVFSTAVQISQKPGVLDTLSS